MSALFFPTTNGLLFSFLLMSDHKQLALPKTSFHLCSVDLNDNNSILIQVDVNIDVDIDSETGILIFKYRHSPIGGELCGTQQQ